MREHARSLWQLMEDRRLYELTYTFYAELLITLASRQHPKMCRDGRDLHIREILVQYGLFAMDGGMRGANKMSFSHKKNNISNFEVLPRS